MTFKRWKQVMVACLWLQICESQAHPAIRTVIQPKVMTLATPTALAAFQLEFVQAIAYLEERDHCIKVQLTVNSRFDFEHSQPDIQHYYQTTQAENSGRFLKYIEFFDLRVLLKDKQTVISEKPYVLKAEVAVGKGSTPHVFMLDLSVPSGGDPSCYTVEIRQP